MQNRRMGLLCSVLACGAALLWMTAQAGADEIQLGGIRLGQHALHVIQVFGQPDGILKGEGQAASAAGAGAAGGVGQMAGAGPGGGAPGGPGGGPGMPGGMAPGGGAARGGGAGGPGGGPGMPGGMGGPQGAGGQGRGAGGMGPGGGMGPQGNGMGNIGGAGGGQGGEGLTSQNWFDNSSCPDWAAPVWLPTQGDEVVYVYRRGTVVIGFLLDRDGYVGAIAVAGRACTWARTAMGAPKRTIKLGDTYRTVLQRYGNPSQTTLYQPVERPFDAAGTVIDFAGSANAGGVANASRDIILHYGFNDNIEFTLQNMKVVRIHIWQPDLREPESRSTGAAAGGQGAGGMMGGPGGQGAGGMMGGPGGGGQGRPGGGPGGPGGGGMAGPR